MVVIQTLIRNEMIREAFTMTYEYLRRYQGAWHTEDRPLFPGCMILDSNESKMNIEECETAGRDWSDQLDYTVLELEEELFLKKISDAVHHIPMSKGYIHDGTTCITEGPLIGLESRIRRIDRHKRLATIEMPGMQGRKIQAGLEIYKKD